MIPPDTRIPDSAASMAQLPPTASPMDLIAPRADPPPKIPKSAFDQALGRWRLQVGCCRVLHCLIACCLLRCCACAVLSSRLLCSPALCCVTVGWSALCSFVLCAAMSYAVLRHPDLPVTS